MAKLFALDKEPHNNLGNLKQEFAHPSTVLAYPTIMFVCEHL